MILNVQKRQTTFWKWLAWGYLWLLFHQSSILYINHLCFALNIPDPFMYTSTYFLSSPALVAARIHWEHGNLTSTCLFRLLLLVATYSHLEQGELTPFTFDLNLQIPCCGWNKLTSWTRNLTPSCLLSNWTFRWLARVTINSHWQHGYLTSLFLHSI